MKMEQTSSYYSQSPFLQKHSVAIRIWHWLTFLTLTFILLTVLFASTLLNPRENTSVVQNMLTEKGTSIDKDQAFSVAHIFDDKMWELHKYLGFGQYLIYTFVFFHLCGVIISDLGKSKGIVSGMINGGE